MKNFSLLTSYHEVFIAQGIHGGSDLQIHGTFIPYENLVILPDTSFMARVQKFIGMSYSNYMNFIGFLSTSDCIINLPLLHHTYAQHRLDYA